MANDAAWKHYNDLLTAALIRYQQRVGAAKAAYDTDELKARELSGWSWTDQHQEWRSMAAEVAGEAKTVK